MAQSKKAFLDSQTEEKIWKLLQQDDEVIIDIKGEEVRLTKLSVEETDHKTVMNEIESDSELKQMLLDSEEDVKVGRVYTAEEAVKFIQAN